MLVFELFPLCLGEIGNQSGHSDHRFFLNDKTGKKAKITSTALKKGKRSLTQATHNAHHWRAGESALRPRQTALDLSCDLDLLQNRMASSSAGALSSFLLSSKTNKRMRMSKLSDLNTNLSQMLTRVSKASKSELYGDNTGDWRIIGCVGKS